MSLQKPLAARMRPRNLNEVIGQDHITNHETIAYHLADPKNKIPLSAILYGPPSTGKSSIALAIANSSGSEFIHLSAIDATIKDVRAAIKTGEANFLNDEKTIVFIDEIHRFNKTQQDALLHALENGYISLIGATTENPYFSVNSAVVSRSNIFKLNPHTPDAMHQMIKRALTDERGLNSKFTMDNQTIEYTARLANGDIRKALTAIEAASLSATDDTITPELINKVFPHSLIRHDRDGDQHYDVISAFIKSMRGSDPQAALHYLARMIHAGEDPRYIARRIMIHAAEDVGMADPSALQTATAAHYAVANVGMPEASIILAQAVIHIATAPKSNEACASIHRALEEVERGGFGEIPIHLRDSHYKGAKALGHGEDYLFPHDYPNNFVSQNYLPTGVTGDYYQPTDNGYESGLKASQEYIQDQLSNKRATN